MDLRYPIINSYHPDRGSMHASALIFQYGDPSLIAGFQNKLP